MKTAVILCGVFYSVLCVFSIVTGLMYASGKKQLNPLELSEKTVSRLSDPEEKLKFTVRMGWVTFFVGIVQGITAYALFRRNSPVFYWVALGFTLFSIASVTFKLKGKVHIFPILKCVAYVAILAVLLLGSTRMLFFA